MLYALDKNIGKLIKTLKEKGLYDNTTIVFTSDNGGLSTVLKTKKQKAPTSVTPLRAGKGWLYEGGIKIPLLIKPSHYNSKNKIIETPVISHDLYPTLIALAGIENKNTTEIDGVNLSPIINEDKNIERDALFWHYPHYHASGWTPGAAIRVNNWKLIEFYDSNHVELYDLSKDISETNNVYSTYPKIAKRLKDRLHTLQKSVNANHVIPNPNFKN